MTPYDVRRSITERCATATTHHAVWDETSGTNVLVRTAVNLDELPERFGVYLIAPGSDVTTIGVLDLDNHGDPPLDWNDVVEIATPIVKHLRAIGHHPMPFRSRGGRGLQIWLVWDAAQEAARVRALLYDAVESCGFEVGSKGLEAGHIEVFPKQDAVPEGDDVGNCIDVPLAGQSVPLDPKSLAVLAAPLPVVSSLDLTHLVVEVARHATDKPEDRGYTKDAIESALAAIPADDYDDWVCVIRALKGAAAKKQLKLTDKKAHDLAEEWSKRSSKHTAREFEYKWNKGCKKDAAGRGRGIGSLFHLAKERGWTPPEAPCCIARIRIQESEPTVFFVTIVGYEDKEITMLADVLTSGAKFRTKVMDAIYEPVKLPKDDDIKRLMAQAERIAADDDATVLGQFKNRLKRFLDQTLQQEKAALGIELNSWHDEQTGRTWFKSEDLVTWLKRERIYDYQTPAQMFAFVKQLGGNTQPINLGQSKEGKQYGTRRCWWVPLNPREDLIELDAARVAPDEEAPF